LQPNSNFITAFLFGGGGGAGLPNRVK